MTRRLLIRSPRVGIGLGCALALATAALLALGWIGWMAFTVGLATALLSFRAAWQIHRRQRQIYKRVTS